MASPDSVVYEFGPFRLDASQHLLFRNGDVISLPPKATETLVVLVQNHGRLVQKDAIMSAVWPDCFVEESNLTVQISLLRKALGESNGTRYIETIPRRGYRFVGNVSVVGDSAASTDSGPEPAVSTTGPSTSVREDAMAAASQAASSAKLGPSLPGKIALVLATTLALGVVALMANYRLRLSRMSETHSRRVVAVLGFKNLSGRPDEAWLSTALSEMLSTELSAGDQLRTVPGENVAQMRINLSLADADSYGKETLNRIRKNLDADDVVLGSYVPIGKGEIRVDLRIQDTIKGETVASVSEKGEEAEIDEMIHRAGDELRERLDVAAVTTADAALVKSTLPANAEAARLYSEGLARMRNFDDLGARDSFEKSVAAQPNFALTHSALATALSRLGYDARAREEAQTAAELSANLDREQQLWILAQELEIKDDLGKAVYTYRTLFDMSPDNIEYGLRLADAQQNDGKGNDALATIAALRKLPPPAGDDPRIDLIEAQTAYTLGDYQQEEKSAQRAGEKARAKGARLLNAQALNEECWALKTLGQPAAGIAKCDEARQMFSDAGDNDSMASALSHIGTILREQGDDAGAKAKMEEALGTWSEVGDRRGVASALGNLAIGLHAQGDLAGAKSMYERALAIFREVGNHDNAALTLGNLGGVIEDIGDLPGARARLEEGRKIAQQVSDTGEDATIQVTLADVLYKQGELSQAAEFASQAAETLRKEGDKRDESVALWTAGTIAMARDNISEAQADLEESLRIRTGINAKVEAGETELELAELALDQGRAADAEVSCGHIVQEFQDVHGRDDEMQARALLVRAILARAHTPDALKQAREELQSAKAMAAGSQNETSKSAVGIADAILEAASGRPSVGEKKLEAVVAQETKSGNLAGQFEAQLALGELELKTGSEQAGRARLQALKKEAEAKGFARIARQTGSAPKS